ncbi:MAG: CRISPR-associated helicase Cas3' [Actinomycetota bacterium]|nr:CRISPR-associated helicase Cas3' [Actinomycetota bacterium]
MRGMENMDDGQGKFYAHTPTEGSEEWHDLVSHLSRTAELAQKNASKFKAGELGRLAGLWHDVGKFNKDFQKYLRDCHDAALAGGKAPRGGSVPHAVYGAMLAVRNASRAEIEWLVPVIHGHHIGLRNRDDYSQALKNPDVAATYEKLLPAASEALPGAFEMDGDEGFVSDPPMDFMRLEFFIRMVFSSLVDADFLDTETHFEPRASGLRGSGVGVGDLWRKLEESQKNLLESTKENPTLVNEIRREVYGDCLAAAESEPGVFRLSVPTGGGKTRSGLAFAVKHAEKHGLDRVIVAVPYTSIIEQTAREYRSIFRGLGEDVVLEHHSAVRRWDADGTEGMEERRARARLASQNWDSPLVVTTTVQLFESLFANRTSRSRKLHNIANSVIVLDEVQTLPLGLLDPIMDVLKELVRRYRVSVVLCTATQPALEETSRYIKGFGEDVVKDIVPEERATEHFSKLKRVEYEMSGGKPGWSEVAGKFLESSPERRGLVVVNALRDALEVLDVLEGMGETGIGDGGDGGEGGSLAHLSTLLCGAHRRDVLSDVRERLKKDEPCLLVSTQVVEAGVDLDFPVVFRAMGPLDRIVQAAGRCNREGTMPELGRVVIFDPDEGRMPPGEYARAVKITRMMLEENPDLHNPAIFRDYFSSLYRVDDLDRHGIQSLREKHNYPEVARLFRFIERPTVPVIVDYEERDPRREEDRLNLIERVKRDGRLSPGDHRRLQPYIVSLFEHDLKGKEWMLEPMDDEEDGVKLWTGNYDPLRGISAIRDDPADLIWSA